MGLWVRDCKQKAEVFAEYLAVTFTSNQVNNDTRLTRTRLEMTYLKTENINPIIQKKNVAEEMETNLKCMTMHPFD